MVAERHAPRDSFAGHQMNTPWDPLHRKRNVSAIIAGG